MRETRQQRRAAERAAVKREQSRHRMLTAAEREKTIENAKEVASRIVNKEHLDKMLATLPTPEMRESTLKSLIPFLGFEVVQETVN